jgi:hypothetical protein
MSNQDLSPPRIVCAAIRRKDGCIVCGPRHFDHTMWKQIQGVAALPDCPSEIAKTWQGAEEGFIDQHGNFWNRRDAWGIADKNGQIIRDRKWCEWNLHSEHLY